MLTFLLLVVASALFFFLGRAYQGEIDSADLDELRDVQQAKDDWYELACEFASKYNRAKAELDKRDDDLLEMEGRNILNANAVRLQKQEVYRLRRQFELLRTHNPNCVGQHECCPCVAHIQKEYVDAALPKDA